MSVSRRIAAAAVAACCCVGAWAAGARADVVVERWGIAGHVQHTKTLTYAAAEEGGRLMKFDLSALPRGAEVHRARLVMSRQGGHAHTFRVFAGKRQLLPAGPYYRWFDVTAAVKALAASPSRALALGLRGRGYEPKATWLEVAYEGKLKDPPGQVKGLRAFYRAGQVFITFREVEDLSEGKDRYAWGDLIKKVRGYNAEGLIPRDKGRELRYRVYRHDKPITPGSIGRAELLAEVVPGSGFNTRIVRRIWQGENRPSKLDDSFIAVRLAVEAEKPLPSGVGLYVHTVGKAGRAFYAVVTAVNGVENTTDLSEANVSGSIDEKVADPEPVLQDATFKDGPYKRKEDDVITRRYCYWAVPPQAPRPVQYGFVMRWHPNRIAKPAALELNHGKSHTVEPDLGRWQRPDAILLVGSAGPENGFYIGANNCHGTLKSFKQGTWGPWTYNRHAKIIEWAKRAYEIDPQQIYCYGSHWGMWALRHPDIFSVFIGWGSAELTKGFVDWNRANGVWGPPSAYEGKPAAENPYEICNFNKYVSTDPSRRLPIQFLVSCTGSHTSEMSYASLPKYKRTLMDAHQPFGAGISKVSWGDRVPAALREYRAGRLKIVRDQSKPAFANCTLDDNPGCGDIRSGDGGGMLNGYLLWETETIVDRPGRWEMTVYLHSSAPLASCKVDLTPRHCQKFKSKAGQKFSFANTAGPSGGKTVDSGVVTADKHGHVTLKQITVGKARNRVVISAAK